MKYFLTFDLRYDVRTIDEDGDIDKDYKNEIYSSKLFDTKQEAWDFGNTVIKNNLWMEQYPGYQNVRFNKDIYSRSLVSFSLRNGANIYIKVNEVQEHSENEISDFLQVLKNI